MNKEEEINKRKGINKVINEKKIIFKSVLTLTIPEEIEIKGSIKELLTKFIKKIKGGIGEYMYCIEETKKGSAHIHILVEKSFEGNFWMLKEKWCSLIMKGYNKERNEKRIKEIKEQALDYKEVGVLKEEQDKIIKYVLKKETKRYEGLLLGEGEKFLLGGSKILIGALRRYERENYNVFREEEKEEEEIIYEWVCKEDNYYKTLDKGLVMEEIGNEIEYLEILISKYDFENVDKTKTSRKSYTLRRLILKALLNYKKDKIGVKVKEGLLKKNLGENLRNVLTEKFFNEDILYHMYNILYICMHNGFSGIKEQNLYERVGYYISSVCKGKEEEGFLIQDVLYIGANIAANIFELYKGVIVIEREREEEGSAVIIRLGYNEESKFFDSLEEEFKVFLRNKIKDYAYQKPMIVRPKKWIGIFKEGEEKTSIVVGGGYLLNGYGRKGMYIKRNIWEKSVHEAHALRVNQKVIDTINKLQENTFRINISLYDIYIKNKKWLPGYLESKKEEEIRGKIKILKKERSVIFSTLKENKELVDKKDVIEKLQKELTEKAYEIEEYEESLGKSKTLKYSMRCLNGIGDKKIYYGYKLDFRGRVYPINVESHPMGSKWVRSLIGTYEEDVFDYNEYKEYAASAFMKLIEFSSDDYRAAYDLSVENYFKKIGGLENIKVILRDKDIEEPFLFCSCYYEYLKYMKSVKKEEYKTNFALYVDATASGPQLISLFFALDNFREYLNLNLQTRQTKKGDFYIGVIRGFMEKYRGKEVPNNINYVLLRSMLKKGIMTQFYGVSYQNFYKTIYRYYLRKEEVRKQLAFYAKNNVIETFIKDFWDYLKKLPLFQLKDLLSFVIKELGEKPLRWEIGGNEIEPDYRKKKKVEYEVVIKGNVRRKFTFYKMLEEKSSKNKSSAMANFIHSLDAYVMLSVIMEVNYDLLIIHDCWGQLSCNIKKTREIVRKKYKEIVENRALYKKITVQLRDYLVKSVSEEDRKGVEEQFNEFIEKKIKLGNLSERDVEGSLYLIYY